MFRLSYTRAEVRLRWTYASETPISNKVPKVQRTASLYPLLACAAHSTFYGMSWNCFECVLRLHKDQRWPTRRWTSLVAIYRTRRNGRLDCLGRKSEPITWPSDSAMDGTSSDALIPSADDQVSSPQSLQERSKSPQSQRSLGRCDARAFCRPLRGSCSGRSPG